MAGKPKTHAQYCADLKQMDHWVVPLESYKNSRTKILHRCKRHNETHPAAPASVLSGHRLQCCHLEALRNNAKKSGSQRKESARLAHRAKLAKLGKAELVGEYNGNQAKTLYRCLIHGEVHEALPCNVLRGQGLACCRREALLKQGRERILQSRATHLEKLARHGRVELVGEYRGGHTKTKYRCLMHNEVHEATPVDVARGQGLLCCKSLGVCRATLIEDDSFANASCHFYLVEVNGAYLKPGIAKSLSRRAKDSEGFYGGYIFTQELTRGEVFAIEQRILNDSLEAKPDVLPETYNKWGGATELRLKDVLPAQWYIDRYHHYLELVAEHGWLDVLDGKY